jgi:hypothetical protein
MRQVGPTVDLWNTPTSEEHELTIFGSNSAPHSAKVTLRGSDTASTSGTALERVHLRAGCAARLSGMCTNGKPRLLGSSLELKSPVASRSPIRLRRYVGSAASRLIVGRLWEGRRMRSRLGRRSPAMPPRGGVRDFWLRDATVQPGVRATRPPAHRATSARAYHQGSRTHSLNPTVSRAGTHADSSFGSATDRFVSMIENRAGD